LRYVERAFRENEHFEKTPSRAAHRAVQQITRE